MNAAVLPAATRDRRLSFAFANRHGIMVKEVVNGIARCAWC